MILKLCFGKLSSWRKKTKKKQHRKHGNCQTMSHVTEADTKRACMSDFL